MTPKNITRKDFIKSTTGVVAGTMLASPMSAFANRSSGVQKKRLALVGTGIRGISFWGKTVRERYGDITEFVGLCDINPGRLEYGKSHIGADCPVFTDFDEMMDTVNPEMLIVTTVDATHHQFIIKGLERGIDVLTEKPMTTDEIKCQRILDAEQQSDSNLIVGFNYRYRPHDTKLKEMLVNERVGKITSVDFHWYLNIYHGASYFRRWHGIEASGGTLLVHKATHHFDLLNWWLDSDPVEVFAYGDLEHYGDNGPFFGTSCRSCAHKKECNYYWDITKSSRDMKLYAENEAYDGYIRDNCVYRPEINIYDKMSAQIKYANNTVVNYSLTTYSPYEGWKIAFNGEKGRIEAWEDIPYFDNESLDQSSLHAAEMDQNRQDDVKRAPVIVHHNFEKHKVEMVGYERGGHGGGDKRLHDKIFLNPDSPDPLKHTAGVRDGAMSVLIGVAARNSIESKRPVRIAELTDLIPRKVRL